MAVGSGNNAVTPIIVPPKLTYSGDPKRTPYFNNGNSKTLRKTKFELRIDYGANAVVNKKITNIYLRSIGQELDASGQPIFDIYEFVAQDLIDSDNTFKQN